MNRNAITSIPSARRLISSLRDLGYGLVDAVAELVDNSIEAGANFVQVNLVFDGDNSYLLIMDNGDGMTPPKIQEAMRFGSKRVYLEEDLGRFGLGLKTASLSQCDEVVVSSRQGTQRARINSLMWSMDHITKVDRWEILKVPASELPYEIVEHLSKTVGTVVYWRKLSRLMGYRWPTGRHAQQEFDKMVLELKMGLGATFHRFLSGEHRRRCVGIFVNGEPVEAWDPFCRSNPKTDNLPTFEIPVSDGRQSGKLTFRPFLLPTTRSFSGPSEAIRAGGLRKWNKQQGFYIYRAGRLLQSGGWSSLRTSDEHTKLVRIMVDIPHNMDEAFKVNISKMRVVIPREIRVLLMEHLAHVIKAGQEKYRSSNESVTAVKFGVDTEQLDLLASSFEFNTKRFEEFVLALGDAMSTVERRMFLSGLRRFAKNFQGADSIEQRIA